MMVEKRMDFKLINWNIGGAKFLALPSNKKWRMEENAANRSPVYREEFQVKLQIALKRKIEEKFRPHVVTLQEVVQFNEEGISEKPKNTFDENFFDDLGYKFHFFPLIENGKFSARMKWDKIKENWKGNPYFAQGNAIMVRNDVVPSLFPVWAIPDIPEFRSEKQQFDNGSKPSCINEIDCASEVVFVEQGLYFGDRNTEPRAAIVTHFVLDGGLTGINLPHDKLNWPIDLFVVNLHLTTLLHEREGIPSLDIKASNRRIKQLDIVFNDIISRYNSWKKEKGYHLSGKPYPVEASAQTERNSPVWIVSGDFNFTPKSAEFEYITKRNFMSLCDDSFTKAKGLGKPPTLTVDYVFAGCLYDSIHPKDVEIRIFDPDLGVLAQDPGVSDHYPLYVVVPIRVDDALPRNPSHCE